MTLEFRDFTVTLSTKKITHTQTRTVIEYPHLLADVSRCRKNGTDGGRSSAMGNTRGGLTTTTYMAVSATIVAEGITIADI